MTLTDTQQTTLECVHTLPTPTSAAVGDELSISRDAAYHRLAVLRDKGYVWQDDDNVWHTDADVDADGETADQTLPDLSDVDADPDADPSVSDLNDRERYVATQLQEGVTVDELAADLDTRETIVTQHLRDLKASGWQVYIDESAGLVTLEGDHALRSSEHTGTRTRKANRWWEKRHSALVRDFKNLPSVEATCDVEPGQEDFLHVIGDVHAGDKVRTPDGTNVYGIDTIAEIFRYDTHKTLELYDYHGVECNTLHLVYNGDLITNSGIYQGQFEDLDAWLDEQHDCLMPALLEQIKAFSDAFDYVNIVCQPGNHGDHRASGTSRQANADLILYKSVRNAIAAVQKYGDQTVFSNVDFTIGEVRPYTNFWMRDGALKCHVRHGQDRKPQATTRAGSDEWKTTLLNHEFSLALLNHHHSSGRIVWDGPPVVVSGTAKPPSDFVDRIAAATSLDPRERAREISHCLAIADHGVSGYYPVKTHDFDYVTGSF